MRNVYRALAGLIALGVVLQSASVVYAVAGLGKYIDDGNSIDKSKFEAMFEGEGRFTGFGGFDWHFIEGMLVIPILALLLLIVSFFAKDVPKRMMWAGLIVLDVIVQVALGLFGHEVPAIGALHGINALILFGLAVMAVMRSGTPAHSTTTDRDYTGDGTRV